ncbi:MAG: redoxin domain-containing protein [Acidobacteria bacterium]|nr:redoxin domain-containing protein [Acidobacteriota bacterium]
MRRSFVSAPLVIGLSLCGLTCQKSAPTTGGSTGVNVNNSAGGARAGAQQPAAPQTQLKVGDRAPDFELTDTEGQKVRLSDFRGKKNVVLAFYVLAFTGG